MKTLTFRAIVIAVISFYLTTTAVIAKCLNKSYYNSHAITVIHLRKP